MFSMKSWLFQSICSKADTAIPVNTVKNRFLVFAATKMQGRAANKAVLSNDKDRLPSDNSRVGKSKAESTATGICFNHRTIKGGKFNLDNTTRGSSLGSWVTTLIPIMIKRTLDLIFSATLLSRLPEQWQQ